MTEKATKAFQRSYGLSSDGIVGPQTLGKALMLGFDAGFEDRVEPDISPVLVSTSHIKLVTVKTRERLFGTFRYESAPTSRNPERIKILANCENENYQVLTLQQLKGIPEFGRTSSARMRNNKRPLYN